MFWFFVLLLIVFCVGYYSFRRLVKIEREIRSAQQPKVVEPELPKEPGPFEGEDQLSEQASELTDAETLLLEILARVRENPGLTQVELYGYFADRDRHELQKMLRDLDQQGRVRREKKGSSYGLFPL